MKVYVVWLSGCGECESSRLVGVFADKETAEATRRLWDDEDFRRQMYQDEREESSDGCGNSYARLKETEVMP